MPNKWIAGGLALALGAVSLPVAAQTAPAKPEKPVSPFVLCDGRTGHVSLGERLGRLALVAATAGLSEVATATDDDSRRLDGVTAARACDTAIDQERDSLRRTQLAMAKAIHLMEAGQLDDALAAARAVASVAGPLAQEWGYQRTLAPRVLMLEAAIQVRRKDADAAQAAAVRAVLLAPYDVALAKRAARYLTLTPSLDAEKDRALTQAGKLLPDLIAQRGSALIQQKRFDDAYAAFTAAQDLITPFYTDFSPQEFEAYRALILALADRGAESDALAAKVQESLSALSGSGFMVQHASTVAVASEVLSMRSILRDLANGHGKEARATFRAHGPWLLAPGVIIPAVVDRLRAGAQADELTGTLADTGETVRLRHLAEQLAALSDAKAIRGEYQQPFLYASTADFARVAGPTWKVGDKPKFLLKHVKDQLPTTDVLDGEYVVDGLPSGEALMLQAALIATSRGLDGFVLKPGRENILWTGLRFGRIGDPGMPALFAFNARDIIADISPHIPQPVPGR